jgi:uncharacterized RDD family membrane protein YckC
MTTGTQSVRSVTSQGHYAGSVSRFLAYAIDITASSAAFALALAAISYVAKVVTGHEVSWNKGNAVVAAVFVAWQFLYFGYSWAASGKTFGMAVLGIRVVMADGTTIEPRRGGPAGRLTPGPPSWPAAPR